MPRLLSLLIVAGLLMAGCGGKTPPRVAIYRIADLSVQFSQVVGQAQDAVILAEESKQITTEEARRALGVSLAISRAGQWLADALDAVNRAVTLGEAVSAATLSEARLLMRDLIAKLPTLLAPLSNEGVRNRVAALIGTAGQILMTILDILPEPVQATPAVPLRGVS